MKKAIQRFLYALYRAYRRPRSRTVRFAFPLTFVALAFLSAAVLMPTNASYIRVASKAQELEKGELFTIDVYAGAHVPVNAVNIELSFPSDQIEITGIDTGESVITIWTQPPYVKGSKVILSGGTYRNGFVGEHLIANVNARAKESGRAKFVTEEVRLLAGDGQGTAVTVKDTGYETLTVYVSGESGVIEGNVEVRIFTDINNDGEIDMADILAFMSAWRNKNLVYDFNNDGRMTFTDFAIILADSFLR